MNGLFQALSSGLARFVYAWLLPSVLAVAAFSLIVWPQLGVDLDIGKLGAVTALTFAAFALSVGFAYGSRPIFQFFEGYTMPRWMAAPLLRRQRREYARLSARAQRVVTNNDFALAMETLRGYPDNIALVLPTRMGNALRGMETYGLTRFGLDSQTFWYELRSIASDKLLRSVDETRAAVDFFMSTLTHLLVLGISCIVLLPWCANPVPPLLTALVCAAIAPLMYSQTVTNIVDWRFAIQALVNLTRPTLASALGLCMPAGLAREREMWEAMSVLVVSGANADAAAVLDPLRTTSTESPN